MARCSAFRIWGANISRLKDKILEMQGDLDRLLKYHIEEGEALKQQSIDEVYELLLEVQERLEKICEIIKRDASKR